VRKIYQKKVYFILLIFSFTVLKMLGAAGVVFSQGKVLVEGEQLNYIVYYGFIKLGEVKMNIEGKRTEEGKTVYSAKATMKSYNGIPFVSLNSVFESDIVYDGKELYSKRFKATEYKDDATIVIEYIFHYDSDYVYVKKINNGKTERDEKISTNKNVKFQDGLSVFYSARVNSFSQENFLIPVFMNEAETSVNYYFIPKPEEISIDVSDKELSSIKCMGVANFTGVFGLTGEFAGWFSNDNARIPLKSLMNVIIGNVSLELDSYKRAGWKIH